MVIAAIALLISGIGIMNIMLVTVKERTREGRHSAKPSVQPIKEIFYQFLIEAFFDQRRRRRLGYFDRLGHSGKHSASDTGKFASACFGNQRNRSVRGVVFDGTFLWIFAGQPGRLSCQPIESLAL